MFGSVGLPELIVIFTIALIIFGPRKLPEIGKTLGKSLAEFKRASNELRNTLESEIRLEDQKTPSRPDTPASVHSIAPAAAADSIPAVVEPAAAVTDHPTGAVPRQNGSA